MKRTHPNKEHFSTETPSALEAEIEMQSSLLVSDTQALKIEIESLRKENETYQAALKHQSHIIERHQRELALLADQINRLIQ